MENSCDNTTLSFLEPVGILLFCNFIIFHFRKLLSNSFTSSSQNGNANHQKRRSPLELEPEDLSLKREEIESIVNQIGLSLNTDSEQMEEETIQILFEENEPSLEEAKEAFYVFDENRDGFIDAEELQRVLSKMGFVEEGLEVPECEKMIKTHDRNNDGKIDFLEFVEFLEGSFC
ncbi:hypothetical protein LUZ60_004311 [Juncus effusus]|nr:hypothetical protein LUZ60_004311 [Juncus effusus]